MSPIKPTPNPPLLASWLLHHAGPRNEALAGDLLEEFHLGRSVRWYWRQALSALAIAYSNAILNRAAVLLFTTLWCSLVPAWLLAIAGVEAHFNLRQRFGQMDWPWSFVCDWGLLLSAGLVFIWTGIALYLISHLAACRNLSLSSFLRGLLASLPALSALCAALVVVPGWFVHLYALHPLPNEFHAFPADLHTAAFLVRLPFFAAILASLWGVSSRRRSRRAGSSG